VIASAGFGSAERAADVEAWGVGIGKFLSGFVVE
jgi:hypothetical protein